MKHFLKIAQNVDVMPLLLALQQKPHLWDRDTLRTTHAHSPHTQVHDIWLRFNRIEEGHEAAVLDQHESLCYPAWYELPQARQIIMATMASVQGIRLGRVILTRLDPGKKIDPHVDSGDHAAYYERYHVVLKCPLGAIFRAEDEEVQMRPGEVWHFNNAVEHEVWNYGDDDRLVMIVDIAHEKPLC